MIVHGMNADKLAMSRVSELPTLPGLATLIAVALDQDQECLRALKLPTSKKTIGIPQYQSCQLRKSWQL